MTQLGKLASGYAYTSPGYKADRQHIVKGETLITLCGEELSQLSPYYPMHARKGTMCQGCKRIYKQEETKQALKRRGKVNSSGRLVF